MKALTLGQLVLPHRARPKNRTAPLAMGQDAQHSQQRLGAGAGNFAVVAMAGGQLTKPR